MNIEAFLRLIDRLKQDTMLIDTAGVGVVVQEVLAILTFLRVEAGDAIEKLDTITKSEWPVDLWPLSVLRLFSSDHDFRDAVEKYLQMYREDERVLYDLSLEVFYRELNLDANMVGAINRTLEFVGRDLRPESIKKLEKRLSRLVTEAG